MGDLRNISGDVLNIIAGLLNGIDLMSLSRTCRRFRDLLAKDEAWGRLFCPDDPWASTEISIHKSWRAVYRSWLRESYWSWKAMQYTQWPTVIGRAKSICVQLLGGARSGKRSLAERIIGPDYLLRDRDYEGAIDFQVHDTWGNCFPFQVRPSPARNFTLIAQNVLRSSSQSLSVTYFALRWPHCEALAMWSRHYIITFDALMSAAQLEELRKKLAGMYTRCDLVFLVETKVDLLDSPELEEASNRTRQMLSRQLRSILPDETNVLRCFRVSNKTGAGIAKLTQGLASVCCISPRRLVTEEEFKRSFSSKFHLQPWTAKLTDS